MQNLVYFRLKLLEMIRTLTVLFVSLCFDGHRCLALAIKGGKNTKIYKQCRKCQLIEHLIDSECICQPLNSQKKCFNTSMNEKFDTHYTVHTQQLQRIFHSFDSLTVLKQTD